MLRTFQHPHCIFYFQWAVLVESNCLWNKWVIHWTFVVHLLIPWKHLWSLHEMLSRMLLLLWASPRRHFQYNDSAKILRGIEASQISWPPEYPSFQKKKLWMSLSSPLSQWWNTAKRGQGLYLCTVFIKKKKKKLGKSKKSMDTVVSIHYSPRIVHTLFFILNEIFSLYT